MGGPLLEVGPTIVGTAERGELGHDGLGAVVEDLEEDVVGGLLRAVEHKLDVGGHRCVVVLEPELHVVGLVGHMGTASDVEQREEGIEYIVVAETEIGAMVATGDGLIGKSFNVLKEFNLIIAIERMAEEVG